MRVQPANSLTATPVEWLWPGYLAGGSLAILDGDPGLGKSLVTLDLTARLTTGRPWPDGTPSPGPASVLLLCDEDYDNVVKPRLTAASADQSRTFLWLRPAHGEDDLPRLPKDLDRLDAELAQTDARLLIIDPIMAFLDPSVMANTETNVRRVLRGLAALARRRNCVILLVRHLNKRAGSQSLYRGGGSIAFVAACRLGWLAGRDPKVAERYVLAQTKNNYAACRSSLAYALPSGGPCVEWQGASLWSADDLGFRRDRPARRRAGVFLRALLESGPRLMRDIKAAAKKQRISKNTLERVKKEFGIRYERICSKGERLDFWLLPGQEVPTGLSDTPEADEILRKLGAQWAGREPEGDEDERLDDEDDGVLLQ